MRRSLFVLLGLMVGSVFATSAAPSCSSSQLCPKKYPCCAEGICGTGTYCLGGCDPLMSYSLNACTPKAVGQNRTFDWPNLKKAVPNTNYLGNASTFDWEYSGSPKLKDGHVILTMPKDSVGTLLSSTHYIWYGKIAADIKSSRGKGVVTGFILMSDVKDEIDFEWVGADLANVQSNFYFQGVTNCKDRPYAPYERTIHSEYDAYHARLTDTNGDTMKVNGDDTFSSWHHYEIDWTPEAIHWSVDGTVVRSLTKKSTWNATGNRFEYPQTPSRMQLSLWPAGRASNAKGTIDWAGGQIDWNSADIRNDGYYSASFANITMQSYEAPAGSGDGSRSYVYVKDTGLESSVKVTNNSTVLPDMGHTGLNMQTVTGSSSTGNDSSTTVTSDDMGNSQSAKSNASKWAYPISWLAALSLLFPMIVS